LFEIVEGSVLFLILDLFSEGVYPCSLMRFHCVLRFLELWSPVGGLMGSASWNIQVVVLN